MCNLHRWIISRPLKFHASPHGIIRANLLLFLSATVPHATAQSALNSPTGTGYPYGLDASFNPSLTVIIVVLVCAFFFIGFFSIYIRECTENSNVGNSDHSADGRLRLSPCGLDPSVLESFPVCVYSAVKDLKIGKGALECAVCINEFEDDETLRLLPKCDHVFHPECIDAWLASHTTCPVCRANLTPNQLAGDDAQTSESVHSQDEQNHGSELGEVQNQVSINVEVVQTTDSQVVEILTSKQNRRVAEKFPRSHSTGHSLVQLGQNYERYTLRLPEEVRKQIVSQRLKRTTSCVVVLPRNGSSRTGYRSGGEGSSRGRQVGRSERVGRSDRWVFTTTPPFFARTGLVRAPKVCGGDEDITAVATSKMISTSVKMPFDRLPGKIDGVEQSSTGPPV